MLFAEITTSGQNYSVRLITRDRRVCWPAEFGPDDIAELIAYIHLGQILAEGPEPCRPREGDGSGPGPGPGPGPARDCGRHRQRSRVTDIDWP